MDVLTDLLQRARARGGVFAISHLGAPWGIAMPVGMPLSIHVLLDGEMWLELDGRAPMRVGPGELVVVASGIGHRLVDSPGARALALDEVDAHRIEGTEATYSLDGGGDRSHLVCGSYRFEGAVCAGLLSAMPDVIHLPAAEADSLHTVVDLLVEEVEGTGAGRSVVLDRLLDLLLVRVMRAWIARPDVEAPAWIRALDHPEIGRALRLIHAEPSRRWRVDDLADAVGLSRATFARKFTNHVGIAPLKYLTSWRMTIAAEQLRDTTDTVARIAHSVGYDNEFAFSVAFRRFHGTPPSDYRADLLHAS